MSNTGDLGCLPRGIKQPPHIEMAAYDLLPPDIRAALSNLPIDADAYNVALMVQTRGADYARERIRRGADDAAAEYRRIIAEACAR